MVILELKREGKSEIDHRFIKVSGNTYHIFVTTSQRGLCDTLAEVLPVFGDTAQQRLLSGAILGQPDMAACALLRAELGRGRQTQIPDRQVG